MTKRLQRKSNAMFANWPVIEYDGQLMQKLTTKIVMPEFIRRNVQLFFNYTLQDSDTRPDIVARRYYGDAKLDWVILFTNKVIDPYFEWPMNQETFTQFIVDKYDSIEDAQSTILRYKQIENQADLTVAEYNNLATAARKYWVAQYDYLGNIKSYKYIDNNYELSVGGYNLLSGTEQQYWEAVSAYDDEVTKNNANKVIRLINSSYIDSFLSEYRKTLQ